MPWTPPTPEELVEVERFESLPMPIEEEWVPIGSTEEHRDVGGKIVPNKKKQPAIQWCYFKNKVPCFPIKIRAHLDTVTPSAHFQHLFAKFDSDNAQGDTFRIVMRSYIAGSKWPAKGKKSIPTRIRELIQERRLRAIIKLQFPRKAILDSEPAIPQVTQNNLVRPQVPDKPKHTTLEDEGLEAFYQENPDQRRPNLGTSNKAMDERVSIPDSPLFSEDTRPRKATRRKSAPVAHTEGSTRGIARPLKKPKNPPREESVATDEETDEEPLSRKFIQRKAMLEGPSRRASAPSDAIDLAHEETLRRSSKVSTSSALPKENPTSSAAQKSVPSDSEAQYSVESKLHRVKRSSNDMEPAKDIRMKALKKIVLFFEERSETQTTQKEKRILASYVKEFEADIREDEGSDRKRQKIQQDTSTSGSKPIPSVEFCSFVFKGLTYNRVIHSVDKPGFDGWVHKVNHGVPVEIEDAHDKLTVLQTMYIYKAGTYDSADLAGEYGAIVGEENVLVGGIEHSLLEIWEN